VGAANSTAYSFYKEVLVNTSDRRQATVGLLRDYMGGRIDRRQLLKSAAAAGVLLPVLSIMRGAAPASAQDASPAADASAGSTITVPADLRTDRRSLLRRKAKSS
jgi:hypothetical protein